MNIIKRLLIGITIVVSIFILSSCITKVEYNGGEEISSGDFIYRVNPETNEAMIFAFSERGKQKSTIVIPTMIDGYRVTTIGQLETTSFGSNWRAYLRSDKLKNLYFHSQLEYQDIKNYVYNELENKEGNNVFYPNKYTGSVFCGTAFFDNRYVSKESFDYQDYNLVMQYQNIIASNISYHLNDDSEYDIFFVDYVDDGGLTNVIPPNPIREGYKFMGWYKESECINKWDFDNDVVPAPIYDNETGELINITRLYAKWE